MAFGIVCICAVNLGLTLGTASADDELCKPGHIDCMVVPSL